MRSRLLLLTLILSFTSFAQADPRSTALDLFETFLTRFSKGEIDAIVDMFADDALFWGTTTRSLATDRKGIDAYFDPLRRLQPGQNIASARASSVLVLSEEAVLVSGVWAVQPAQGGAAVELRVSMVLAQREGAWKIVQFHNSRMPE